MKNLFNVKTLLAAMLLISFIACDDTETDEINGSGDPLTSTDYSTKTEEESKKDIEDAGIELVNQIDALEDSEAIDVMMQLTSILGSEEDESVEPYNMPLKAAKAISEGKGASAVFAELKSATEVGMSLQEEFNKQTATYRYNFDTEEIDSIPNSEAIVFEFPGAETDTENTASITIDNFSVFTLTDSHDDFPADYVEAPKTLNAKLSYNGTDLITYSLVADYMANGVPTKIYNTLTIGTFSFEEKFDHSDYKEGSISYAFKNDSKVLIGIGAELSGDWSKSNIDNNIEEKSDTTYYSYPEYNPDTDMYEDVEYSYVNEWTETSVENIIKNGNAYIEILGLKLAGEVDFNKMIPAMDAVYENDEDSTFNESAAADQQVEIAKEHMKMVMVYKENNKLIAALAPYKAIGSYQDYDYDTGQMVTKDEYYLDFKLVFKDESAVSAETYLQNELSSFFNAINSFISKLNKDYEMGMEPVSPDDIFDEEENEEENY